jgi:hypothetical protein
LFVDRAVGHYVTGLPQLIEVGHGAEVHQAFLAHLSKFRVPAV